MKNPINTWVALLMSTISLLFGGYLGDLRAVSRIDAHISTGHVDRNERLDNLVDKVKEMDGKLDYLIMRQIEKNEK